MVIYWRWIRLVIKVRDRKDLWNFWKWNYFEEMENWGWWFEFNIEVYELVNNDYIKVV